MGVYTEYDRKRDELKDMLNDCIKFTEEELMTEKNWGHDEMRSNYASDVYKAIKDAIESV
jgi:hypothetical protein